MAEDKTDRAGKDSFPASDAPANSGIIGPRVKEPAPADPDPGTRPEGKPTGQRRAAGAADPGRQAERSRRK